MCETPVSNEQVFQPESSPPPRVELPKGGSFHTKSANILQKWGQRKEAHVFSAHSGKFPSASMKFLIKSCSSKLSDCKHATNVGWVSGCTHLWGRWGGEELVSSMTRIPPSCSSLLWHLCERSLLFSAPPRAPRTRQVWGGDDTSGGETWHRRGGPEPSRSAPPTPELNSAEGRRETAEREQQLQDIPKTERQRETGRERRGKGGRERERNRQKSRQSESWCVDFKWIIATSSGWGFKINVAANKWTLCSTFCLVLKSI